MHKIKRTSTGKLHFTLMELLIVIAIIVILAGLLLPALKTARDMSKKIQCKGNFKQINLGLMMYVDDYKMYPLRDALTGNPRFWPGRLASYIDTSLSHPTPDAELGAKGRWIFCCPSYQPPAPDLLYLYRKSYGLNADAVPSTLATRYFIRLKNDIVIGMDTDNQCYVSVNSGTTYYPQEYGSFRHLKQANLLWIDGHISSSSREMIDLDNFYPTME